MKVVTVLNDFNEKGFVEFLNPSCEFFKLNAIAIGYEGAFFSNRLKDALLYSYLDTIDEDEIVFFTDAIDAVFVCGEEEILKKFALFKSELVFSAEVNCWPDNLLEKDYPNIEKEFHFKYLNSGGFIGKAGYIKELYQKYPIFETGENQRFLWSNQYYWNILFKNEWPRIQLDYLGEIFYNTCIPVSNNDELLKYLNDPVKIKEMVVSEKKRLDDEITFYNGRMRCNLTGATPCHIHFPGTISKQLMEQGYFNSLKKFSKAL